MPCFAKKFLRRTTGEALKRQLSQRRSGSFLIFNHRKGVLLWIAMYRTQNLHVKEIVRLLSPRELKGQLASDEAVSATVARSRERIIRILRQEDPRMLVVIGPCSIHEKKSALEYAERLNAMRKELADRME